MIKKYLKIIIGIITIFILLTTLVNDTKAFLDSDLGINLYTNIDKGIREFDEKMYVYELSGQEIQDIATNVNMILKTKNIGNCLKSDITIEDIEKINKGIIETLANKMTEECYNPETKTFSSSKIYLIVNEIQKARQYYINQAKQKAKAIYNISRVGLYSDGIITNSPYDIKKDLDDIALILFKNKIEYETEDINFLKEYLDKPLISPILANGGGNNGSVTGGGGTDYNPKSDNNDTTPDGNKFKCITDESGLNEESLNLIKLPNSNQIDIGGGASNSNIIEQLGGSSYNEINDNDNWPCNDFFCIKINYITRNQEALDYGIDKSIQNIIETSNKHLKKAMNTSLVQSKMTTNNFELSLRDLNLPDLFHIGVNLTFKSPPILELDNEYKNNSEYRKKEVYDILYEKYKNFGLNYENPNNLVKFNNTLKEIKSLFLATEKSGNRVNSITQDLNEINKLKIKILEYKRHNKLPEHNIDILDRFNKQFLEISQFTTNIGDYVDKLEILIQKLKEIPIYTG